MVMITLTGSRVENFGFYLELGNKFAVLRWLVAGRTRAPLAVGSLTRRRSSLTLTSVQNLVRDCCTRFFCFVLFFDPIKTSKPSSHIEVIVLDGFPSDRRLCVVIFFKAYLQQTNRLEEKRQNCSSQPKLHTGESQETLYGDGQICHAKGRHRHIYFHSPFDQSGTFQQSVGI